MSSSRQTFFDFGTRRSVVKGGEEDVYARTAGFGQSNVTISTPPTNISGMVESSGDVGIERKSGFRSGIAATFEIEVEHDPSLSVVNDSERATPQRKEQRADQPPAEQQEPTMTSPKPCSSSEEANGEAPAPSAELSGLDALRAQRVVVKLRREIFGRQDQSTIDALDKLVLLLGEFGKQTEVEEARREVWDARYGSSGFVSGRSDEYERVLKLSQERRLEEQRDVQKQDGGRGRMQANLKEKGLRGRRSGRAGRKDEIQLVACGLTRRTFPLQLGSTANRQRYGRQSSIYQKRRHHGSAGRRFRRPYALGRRRGPIKNAKDGKVRPSRYGSARWSHINVALERREREHRRRLMCEDITTTTYMGMSRSRGKEIERDIRTPRDYEPSALVNFFKQGRARKESTDDTDMESSAVNTEQEINLSTPAGSGRAGTSTNPDESKEDGEIILIIEDTHQRGSARSRGKETESPLRSRREVVEFFSGGRDLEGSGVHPNDLSDGDDPSKATSHSIRPTWWGNMRGATRSREEESLNVRSMGFGRRLNTSEADPHPGPKDDESPLAKASRLARAETEPEHASLDIRRRDIVSFQPFKGVTESREVPVYERHGVKRGTDKEEYERWKAKEEEDGKARKKEVELKAKSRYASSFKPKRAAWRDEKEPSFAGRIGAATSSGSERAIIPTMQSHDDKKEEEEYERRKTKEDEEEAKKKEAEPKAKSRYASSFKPRRAAWREKEPRFAGRTDIPANGKDRESIRQSDTTTPYNTETQMNMPLSQLEDRFESLKMSSGLPQEMSWEQLIEALEARKDTESLISRMNDSNKAGGVTGGGTSWHKLLAVLKSAVQPGSRSKTQEDLFTSIKFELGLPKEMTWDEFTELRIGGTTESREPPSHQRESAEKSFDRDDHGGWILHVENDLSVTAYPRYSWSSDWKDRKIDTITGQDVEVDPAGVGGMEVDDDTTKADKGKGKEVAQNEQVSELLVTQPSPEPSEKRPFNDVWQELCVENGWDETDEVKRKMYQELVGKIAEREGKVPAPRPEVAAERPSACSYGSTESRGVLDERMTGFGRTRDDATRRLEREMREARAEMIRGNAPSREAAFRREYEEENSRLRRLNEENQLASMEQELKHATELELLEFKLELERLEREGTRKKGSTESREPELRRNYEDEHARLEHLHGTSKEKYFMKSNIESRKRKIRRKYEEEQARLTRLEEGNRHARMERDLKRPDLPSLKTLARYDKEKETYERFLREQRRIDEKLMDDYYDETPQVRSDDNSRLDYRSVNDPAGVAADLGTTEDREMDDLRMAVTTKWDQGVGYSVPYLRRPGPTCQECSRRKLECDRLRPSCSRCKMLGRDCVYRARGGMSALRTPQADEEERRQIRDQYKTKGSTDSREDELRRKYEAEKAHLERLKREQSEDLMKHEPSPWTANTSVSSDNRSYYRGSGECREDDNERVMWYGGPARIGFGRSAWSDREREGLVKDHRKALLGDMLDRTAEGDTGHQEGVFTTIERADSYSSTDEQKEKFRGYSSPEAILRGTAASREQHIYAREEEQASSARLQIGIVSSGMTESRGSQFGETDEWGSTMSRETELRREYEGDTFEDILSPEAIMKRRAIRSEKQRLERLTHPNMPVKRIAPRVMGVTESRGHLFGKADDERGTASSREAALRREYEAEKHREQRRFKDQFVANMVERGKSRNEYSIGKEHIGDSNDGFRSSSTIGTTSAEKMPMRGGNDAALINEDGVGEINNDDDDDAEVNLEGLVLRTRVQVPDAMRRAMENDEEWRSFA